MAILADLICKKRSNLRNPSAQLVEALTSGTTTAGMSVTQDSALKYSPVWAAVNIIAGAVGYLPFHVYKRTSEGRQRAADHNAYRLIHDVPNPRMTAQVFREAMTGLLLLWGNCYAEIERNGSGQPVALWPIDPERVKRLIFNSAGGMWYEIQNVSRENTMLPAEKILHLPGLGSDGYLGYSVISYHRESIALGRAAEKYGAAFFGNNAQPGGVLTHPETLSDDAWKELKARWEDAHQGLDNSHRVAVLQDGMAWTSIGVPAKDSQLIETRRFQIADVARMFQVPLHMLGDLERATFSNIEHQGIEFVTFALMRWLRKWEHECNRKLIPEAQQGKYYTEFSVEGLLRGDSKARSEFYKEMFNNGFFTLNEVREMENKNRVSGEGGDTHFVNAALVPVERAIEEPVPEPVAPPKDEEEEEDRVASAHLRHFEELWQRILLKEHRAMRKAAKNPDRFDAFAEDFYQKHIAHICEVLTRTSQTCATTLVPNTSPADIERRIRDMATEHCRTALSERDGRARADQPSDAGAMAGQTMAAILETNDAAT